MFPPSRWRRVGAFCLSFSLAACGGGSGLGVDSSSLHGDGTGRGQLLPPVSGLDLGASNSDADGQFSNTGQRLHIALGVAPIGALKARARLSWFDLVGHAAQYTDDRAVRLMRTLYALDEGAWAGDGVSLTASALAQVDDYRFEGSDTAWLAAAASLVARSGVEGARLPSAAEALDWYAVGLSMQRSSCTPGTASLANPAPRCSDLARWQDWHQVLASAADDVDTRIEAWLDSARPAADWWPELRTRWRATLGADEHASQWLATLVSGGRVTVHEALEASASACAERCDSVLDQSAALILDDWREDLLSSRRLRDRNSRDIAARAVARILIHGQDLEGLRDWSGQGESWQARRLIAAVAAAAGVDDSLYRAADADAQVLAALAVIDTRFAEGVAQWSGAGGSNDDPDAPSISAVDRPLLVIGHSAEFSVRGSQLDADITLQLADCPMLAQGGDDSVRRFSCTPIGAAGDRTISVLDGARVLWQGPVSVAAGTTEISVASVAPTQAPASGPQRFVVRGSGLHDALRFLLDGCTVESNDFEAERWTVQCQLGPIDGDRIGEILDGDGRRLFAFAVAANDDDPQPFRVDELVVPSAVYAGDDVLLTVRGSGFDATANLLSTGCERISMDFRSASELRATCSSAQTGNWPVSVVVQAGRLDAPETLSVQLGPVEVAAVTPDSGVAGSWVNLRVSGGYLPERLSLALESCTTLTPLGGTRSLRQFGCEIGRSGSFTGSVILDGETLYQFAFNASADPDIVVDRVSPDSATFGETVTVLFEGSGLPSDARMSLPGCALITLIGHTDAEMSFSCTPQQGGVLSGELQDSQGGVLKRFTIDVQGGEPDAPTPVVDALTPSLSRIGALTTFTLSGHSLTPKISLSMPGCGDMVSLGGNDLVRQYRCTPTGATGTREISVHDADGSVLKRFEVQLVGDEPLVSSVSPTQAAVGSRTLFYVRGVNLDASIGLSLNGCSFRSQAASSSFTRVYACTPTGTPGLRALRVVDRGSGATLYSAGVNVTGPR